MKYNIYLKLTGISFATFLLLSSVVDVALFLITLSITIISAWSPATNMSTKAEKTMKLQFLNIHITEIWGGVITNIKLVWDLRQI